MNLLKTTLLATATIAALASCRKADDTEGAVCFSLDQQAVVADVVTRSYVSDYTTLPSASDFTITVKSGSSTVYSGLLSGYDSSTKLNAGNYTVDAVYGAEGEEGFDKPYFTGSTAFAVQGGATTSVSIPVSLANSIIKVAVTSAFENYFKDWSFTVSTGSSNTISFPKGETRAAFVDAYRFTVSGTMTSQSGAASSFSKEYTSGIEAATCYTLRFDVSNVGGLTVTVTFNDTVETVDLGTVELND